MAFRNLAGEIYRCLHEVCTMTHKLINYTPDCDYLASHTCTSNFVELAQIENSHLAMADFDKALLSLQKL